MPSHSNSTTLVQMNLSYVDMNMARDGSVLTKDQIREERIRQGYCTECRGTPVRLFNIRKARFNPLWSTKEPCTIEGESLMGKCLHCHPRLDPNYHKRKPKVRCHRRVSTHNNDGRRRASENDTNGGGGAGAGRGGMAHSSYGAGAQSMMHLNSRAPPPQQPPRPLSQTTPHSPVPTSQPPITRNGLSPAGSSHRDLLRSPNGTNHQNSGVSPASAARASPAATVNPLEIPIVPNLLQPVDPRVSSTDAVIDGENSNSGGLMNDSSHYEEEDEREIMFARCQRLSSMRNLRQSSIANLMAPPSDASPILTNLIRNANSPPRESNAHVASRGRSSRSLYVPPPPPPPPDEISSSSDSPQSNHRGPPTPPQRGPPTPPRRRTPTPPPPREDSPPPRRVADAVVVAELESLVKDVSMAGNADFTADILVGAMRDYPDSIPVQLFCLGTVWDLCKDSDENKASIITTSAPDDILMCMKRHMGNAEVQERACGALWSLSVNQHNRVIIIRAGAASRIIKSIGDHLADENVIRTAVGCLRTLSPESEVRELMGALQGIKHVCEAMMAHRSSASIQRDGCAFLSNSAVDLDKQQVALAAAYEFDAIVIAMTAHKNDASVMAGACFALKNYTYEERNVRALAALDNIVSLLENTSLYSQDSNGRRDASIVLERVQNCKEDDTVLENQILVSLQESPPQSVESALELTTEYEWSANITGAVFGCLVSLAQSGPEHRADITGVVLKDVIQKMEKMAGNAVLQINGCTLLEAMAESGYPRVTLVQNGVVKVVVAAMRKHESNVDMQIAATALLKLLSTKFECWFELQGYDTNPIMEVLAAHADSAIVQENGAAIMTNLSVHG